MNNVTFIVVTPTFNSATYLDETISNVVSQRGQFTLRYHIQDGGSTDGTVEILKCWENRLSAGNPMGGAKIVFSWQSKLDAGMYDAIAAGFEHALAELENSARANVLMTWINSDDLFAVNALSTACAYFIEHPEFHWITGMGALINEFGAAVTVFQEPQVFVQKDIACGFHDGRKMPLIQQEGTFWRFKLWNESAGLCRSLRLAGDWDLWRRFAANTPLVKIQTVLGLHRRHAEQLSADPTEYYSEIDVVLSNGMSCPPALREFGYGAVYDIEARCWNAIEIEVEKENSTPLEDSTPLEEKIKVEVEKKNSTLLEAKIVAITNRYGDLAQRINLQLMRLIEVLPQHKKLPVAEQKKVLPKIVFPETLPGGRPWPKISVITPSFNQGRYIAETIESVIQQGYPFVEHIIIDGGSSDETMEVVERYRQHLAYVVSERDRGQSDAINKGFKRATGEILCWLNSDDRFAPGALAAVAMAFATSKADVVSGICEVYENGRLVQRHMSACADGPMPLDDMLDLDNGWNAGQFFYQPEVFFSRAIWERAGAHVREDCYYSMDYELWCRFAASGAKLHVIGAPLAWFRVHPEQKTADPSKFKAELVGVRKKFATERSLSVRGSNRPDLRWDKSFRVALVNDIGARYGAGIAHSRLAAGIDMAGHTVEMFDLESYRSSKNGPDEQALISAVIEFRPNIVLFGNLHSANRDSVKVLAALGERFASFWITHDFWLFTGRCAYTGKCQKYLTGCDASCPTPNEYPDLAPGKIADAWKRKYQLLSSDHAPVVLGNSKWSAEIAQIALATVDVNASEKVSQVKLGAPTHLFKPTGRASARSALGINQEHFVIAFSVSSMTDERKGGHFLIDALRGLKLPNISVLLIGNLDAPFDVPGVEIVSLGYVSDTATLVAALNAANVYVGPSTEETFGQVFIEAALVGTPSIGFDQSGVRDAIIDGVTGLRVQPSAQGLQEGILRLYEDRALCNSLGQWAHIYAANEFSLEASYHSLFNVWRARGLVDRFELPHKVGFVRRSNFVEESLGVVSSWRASLGISSVEGPYPHHNVPTPFRWCHGKLTRFNVNCPEGGLWRVRIVYYSSLFEQIQAEVHVNGKSTTSLTFSRTVGEYSNTVDIQIDALPGWNKIDLIPNIVRTPSVEEPRALTFMLKDIEIHGI